MPDDVLREVVIEEDEKKQKALEIFSDNYTRVILSTLMEKPKTASEVSDETKIPSTTVYRKIGSLLDNNLVRISGQISENGKKNFLYKSKIRSFHITFTKDKFTILANTNGSCKFCLH